MSITLLSCAADQTSDPVWLARIGQPANWKHTKTFPGGCSSATFDFIAPPDLHHRALQGGRTIYGYSGTSLRFRGRLEQPVPGAPWSCTVTGIAAVAKDYQARATFVSQSWSYTGSDQTYVVPDRVTMLSVALKGAGGGGNGGKGVAVTGTFPVSPGDTIRVVVGGQGITASTSTPYGGGGAGGSGASGAGCSGGGGTFIYRNGTLVAVAAGGGGAGRGSNGGAGGDGGDTAGTAGGDAGWTGSNVTGGGGGTQSAGGSGGAGSTGGSSGSSGSGGTGAFNFTAGSLGGGGGGGGFEGGGGGGSNTSGQGSGGGGGASSYTGGLIGPQTNPGGGASANTSGSAAVSAVPNIYNLSDSLPYAIADGLPWVISGTPTSPAGTGATYDATIDDVLGSLIDQGLYWHVTNNGGFSTMTTLPAATFLLYAVNPPARVLDGYATRVALSYVDSGGARHNVLYTADPSLIAKYGTIDTRLDLTGAGALTSTQADTIGAAVLAKYAANGLPWSSGFTVLPGQLFTMGGTMVTDLSTLSAHVTVRVIELTLDGELPTATDVPVGQIDYDDTSGQLTLTPLLAAQDTMVATIARAHHIKLTSA